MAMKAIVPPDARAVSYTTVPHSLAESQRNFNIQGFWNAGVLRGNVKINVDLPGDAKNSQATRWFQQIQQSVQPWQSRFMVTPTDAARLNNPAQASAVKQRQLAPPNTYGQFYAFMHALSAAFGSLQSSGR
jgi:hypothetical protein